MTRILVVDDSLTQRLIARVLLEDLGYEVVEAIDGSSTLEVAVRESPDCILLDLCLPDDTGQGVLQSLHAKGLTMPVIVSSASIDEDIRRECLELGAAAVMGKPEVSASNELKELIQSVLKS